MACGEGEPGFIVARGRNVFAGYVGADEATAAALEGGWYLNLGDVGYTLGGALYWQSRASARRSAACCLLLSRTHRPLPMSSC